MSPKLIGWTAVILVATSISPVYGECYDQKFENLMTVLDVRSKKLAGQEKLRGRIKQFVQKKALTDADKRHQSNMRESLTILEEHITAEKEYQNMLKNATKLYISLAECPVRPRGVLDYITRGKVQSQDQEKWEKFKEAYSASFKQRDKVDEVAKRAQEALIRQKLETE